MKPHAIPTDSSRLLRDHARAALYGCNAETALELVQACPAAAFKAWRIDMGRATNVGKLHRLLADSLNFPDYYGHNWDALADCLGDMSWSDAEGHVVVFRHAEIFAAASPEDFETLLEVLHETVAFWQAQDQAFWVLFVGDFPQLPQLESGI